VRCDTPSRARRRTTEEARREIIDSAVAFLSSRSFRDLTVGELMAATTLSRPAFYQHFSDLHGLIESLVGDIEAVMHRTANPWIGGEGEPLPALRESLAAVVEAGIEHGPVLRAIAEAAPLDERLERAWSAFMGRWDDEVEVRIQAQQREGLIPRLDARRIANALNTLNAALVIAEFGRQPQGDPKAVLDTLYRIWTATLYGPGIESLPGRPSGPPRAAARSPSRRKYSAAQR
jgi:AcrR family transcriptional regulator